MAIKRISSHEYKHSCFYLILREAPEYGTSSYILCCGIDIMKFDPFAAAWPGSVRTPHSRACTAISAIALEKAAQTAKMDDYGECMLSRPRARAGTGKP